MAVNLKAAGELLPVDGVRLSSSAAGIRYQGRDDLLMIELAEGSQSAGVFTQNRFCAAPVLICRDALRSADPRLLVINSGNANAGTGEQGLNTANAICSALAEQLGVAANQVLPFSTGVIGEQLPLDTFLSAIPGAVNSLSVDGWADAAATIMTTDTLAKGISKQVEIDGKTVTLTGIAKGAGMIEPNMATMLAFVATDAAVNKALLQSMLIEATQTSFNSITVDGDTSTNDALMLMATGRSGAEVTAENASAFIEALNEVCLHLAQAIIRDAEGATKFITLAVESAPDIETARAIAFTVARSPLVKTALFASDPNWGRILAAIGRSPVNELDIDSLDLWIGETCLLSGGQPAESYTEEQGQVEMDRPEITIRICLNQGQVATNVWTSDLSHDYVTINAEYRS